MASAGVPFAFLPVAPEAVARAEPDAAAIRAAASGLTGLAVVAVDRATWHVHARVFCPEVGVVEDPATGSAGVALAVFLAGRGVLPDGWTTLTVEQGVRDRAAVAAGGAGPGGRGSRGGDGGARRRADGGQGRVAGVAGRMTG